MEIKLIKTPIGNYEYAGRLISKRRYNREFPWAVYIQDGRGGFAFKTLKNAIEFIDRTNNK
jgi:hypothetical protein